MDLTLLRTAAGSAPSVSQYRWLRGLGVRVIAADADPLSAGFHFADVARRVPRVNDPGYLDALLALCTEERVNAILPALDEELLLLSRNRARFAALGVRLLLSRHEALEVCTDKLATFAFFRTHGIPTPETWDGTDPSTEAVRAFPAVVKPRSGRGSTGVFLARSEEEVRFFCRYAPGAVVQRLVCGTEYTIDVLADEDGTPCIVAPRKRLATDSGISFKGATGGSEEMRRWAGVICRLLPITGPANIQCFVDADGALWFTEVNARLAGSAILSIAAGVPLLEAIVAMCQGENPEVWTGRPADQVMLRFWSEVFLSPQEAGRFGWRAP